MPIDEFIAWSVWEQKKRERELNREQASNEAAFKQTLEESKKDVFYSPL